MWRHGLCGHRCLLQHFLVMTKLSGIRVHVPRIETFGDSRLGVHSLDRRSLHAGGMNGSRLPWASVGGTRSESIRERRELLGRGDDPATFYPEQIAGWK